MGTLRIEVVPEAASKFRPICGRNVHEAMAVPQPFNEYLESPQKIDDIVRIGRCMAHFRFKQRPIHLVRPECHLPRLQEGFVE